MTSATRQPTDAERVEIEAAIRERCPLAEIGERIGFSAAYARLLIRGDPALSELWDEYLVWYRRQRGHMLAHATDLAVQRRVEKIAAFLRENPHATNAEIGEAAGISAKHISNYFVKYAPELEELRVRKVGRPRTAKPPRRKRADLQAAFDRERAETVRKILQETPAISYNALSAKTGMSDAILKRLITLYDLPKEHAAPGVPAGSTTCRDTGQIRPTGTDWQPFEIGPRGTILETARRLERTWPATQDAPVRCLLCYKITLTSGPVCETCDALAESEECELVDEV